MAADNLKSEKKSQDKALASAEKKAKGIDGKSQKR